MRSIRKEYPKGMKGKSVLCRLRAAERLPLAKKGLSFVLAALVVASPILALLFLLLGWVGAEFYVLLLTCAAPFCAALLSLLSLAFLSARYAGLRTPKGRYSLMTAYIRGRLYDALSLYRPLLLVHRHGEALYLDARQYADRFVLKPQEYEALLSAEDIDVFGERICAPYSELLEYFALSDADEALRYLTMRAEMREAIRAWCQRVFSRYAPAYYPLISRNMHLFAQTVAEDRRVFMNKGASFYRHLLDKSLFYEDPERGGKRLPIPRRYRSLAFSALSDRLRGVFAQDVAPKAPREDLEEYKQLFDAYDLYASTYTLYGCDTVNIDYCRRQYERALADTTACFRCGFAYHDGRHRTLCQRCGHDVCPSCGACYCERVILHTIEPMPLYKR